MNWGEASTDDLDQAISHMFGLASAGLGRVCELIREVDRRQAWMADGARSLSDWVAARLDVRHKTARMLVRVARRLADLPELQERFASGELSMDQVDAISKMATPETEAGLIEEAIGLSNAALDRKARRNNPPSTEEERKAWSSREMYMQWNLDRSVLDYRGRLPGAEAELFQSTVEAKADQIGPNPDSGVFDPYPSRLADGLMELVTSSADADSTSASAPQVVLHADLEALTTDDSGVAELSSGALIPNDTARRLGCDCVLETVVRDGRTIVGVGRNSRTIPGWLRRLVYYRDGGRCQFPGCGSTRWLQVHHIQHWADGGTTDLDNLILLCGHHHRFLHEHGWHITGDPNDRVTFRRPDWRPYPQAKPELHPRVAALVGSGRPS